MFELTVSVGSEVILCIVQIILGSVLSIPIYLVLIKGIKREKTNFFGNILGVCALSLLGMAIPLNVYGLLPITAALLAAGFKNNVIFPFLVSNGIFNMLVPFTEPDFIWKTGIWRAVLALLAGVSLGGIMILIHVKDESMFREKIIALYPEKPSDLGGMIKIVGNTISLAGIYLIAGSLIDAVFHRYILSSTMNLIFTNSHTSFIPFFFARHDVTNPVFLLVLTIISILMNLTNISALFAILRTKGLVAYFGCFLTLVIVLSVPVFI